MEASEKTSVASGRHQEDLYLRFVTCRKQSSCKAKMLPSYTSLLKKFKQFSKRFDWLFTAVLTNRGIGKGIGDSGKGIKKNDIYDM